MGSIPGTSLKVVPSYCVTQLQLSAELTLPRSARAKLTDAYSHSALQQQLLTILDQARAVHARGGARPTPRRSDEGPILWQA